MTQLNEKERELAALLSDECQTSAELTAKLKNLFAGALEKMLKGEMDEHLGYEKKEPRIEIEKHIVLFLTLFFVVLFL